MYTYLLFCSPPSEKQLFSSALDALNQVQVQCIFLNQHVHVPREYKITFKLHFYPIDHLR